jgi:hypothetical protein
MHKCETEVMRGLVIISMGWILDYPRPDKENKYQRLSIRTAHPTR